MATEAQHQKLIFDWSRSVRKTYPELALLFHIPNGGRRDAIEARHLKQQGVKRGVPDLCLPVPRGGYHALYIELKTEKGRVSKEQRWWLERLNKTGCLAVVCHGWREATWTIENYLKQQRSRPSASAANAPMRARPR